MKLYKLSIFALALVAGAFTSCDDDDSKYVVGPQSAGAYFSNQTSNDIILSKDATTAEIPVMRTDKGNAQTVTVNVTDESGLFTIPTTVAFADGSTTSSLTVTYDPAKLEFDKPYPVTISIADDQQTEYGSGSRNFNLILKSPVISLPSTTGNYLYMILFDGVDPDLDITITYTEGNESVKTYTIENVFGGVDFAIVVDENDVDEQGNYICHWNTFYTKVVYPEGEIPIYCSEYWPYAAENEQDYYKQASYFNPQTGLFSLFCFFILEDGRAFNPGYEYCQLDGYPDYSVGVTYEGMFTNPQGATSVVGTIDVGSDVEQAIVANIKGTDVETAIGDMIEGTIETITLPSGLGQEVRFPINGGGSYTMIAITKGGGEYQSIDYATYKINTSIESGIDMTNWTTIGYAPYCDGWIIQLFGEDPFDWVDKIYVEVQVHNTDENLVRLLNPYWSPVYENVNENTTKDAAIVINAEDLDCCYIEPQYSGFTLKVDDITDWYVSDICGWNIAVADVKAEAGEEVPSIDIIKQWTMNNGYQTTLDEGIISVPFPMFGPDNWDTNEKWGYMWIDQDGNPPVPTEIYLTDMVAPSQAKAKMNKPAQQRLITNIIPNLMKNSKRHGKDVYKMMIPMHSNYSNSAKRTLEIHNRIR